jgi:hypothetical protein
MADPSLNVISSIMRRRSGLMGASIMGRSCGQVEHPILRQSLPIPLLHRRLLRAQHCVPRSTA